MILTFILPVLICQLVNATRPPQSPLPSSKDELATIVDDFYQRIQSYDAHHPGTLKHRNPNPVTTRPLKRNRETPNSAGAQRTKPRRLDATERITVEDTIVEDSDEICGRKGFGGDLSPEDRQAMRLMCDYWPTERWGEIDDGEIDEVSALAKSGRFGAVRERSREWTKSMKSSSRFCWRKVMKKRNSEKAWCKGPGLSGKRPGFAWKCKRNCKEFCKDEFQNYLGKTHHLMWCKCGEHGKHARMVDPPCPEGQSLIMGKCYKPCPARMEPSIIPWRCSTDCTKNSNGLVTTCGLGCTKSSADCARVVGAMVATVSGAVLGAVAEFAPPMASGILLSVSKMVALAADIVQELSYEIESLIKGHGLKIGRLLTMGSMMFSYFNELRSPPEMLEQGAWPFAEAIEGFLSVSDKPVDSSEFKEGVENLISQLQEKYGNVARTSSHRHPRMARGCRSHRGMSRRFLKKPIKVPTVNLKPPKIPMYGRTTIYENSRRVDRRTTLPNRPQVQPTSLPVVKNTTMHEKRRTPTITPSNSGEKRAPAPRDTESSIAGGSSASSIDPYMLRFMEEFEKAKEEADL
ncbi:hypothetical protein FOL47_007299 [Perkinsus chesapeaki]|uniref:Uncharacterized protein n=1 Tax=Perkinsus chesapeaki TaxID=330153 RepID=A0A7J6LLT5_PERCH|nr:hypothetical protein FOL47_007299 [Perkinsus chesapeaki]